MPNNYFNEEKNLIYSWIIDGSKISEVLDFSLKINFSSNYTYEIGEISNYSDGKYIHFEHQGDLPAGTKVKLYVGDKFIDDKLVNVYFYDHNTKKLELIKQKLVVKNGYIEFEINHCSDYFVTMATIGESSETVLTLIFMIVSIVEFVLIAAILILDYLKINPILKLKIKKSHKYLRKISQ